MSEPTASIGRPHLTVKELAARLHCVDRTVRRNYQRWGLKPIAITGMLLFPFRKWRISSGGRSKGR